MNNSIKGYLLPFLFLIKHYIIINNTCVTYYYIFLLDFIFQYVIIVM